jgi:hypothetical protein
MKKQEMLTRSLKLADLEAHLAGALRPVRAPREFINRLGEGIHIPPREQIVLHLGDWRRLFFVFSGVISGMLVLMTVARALLYVSGRRNL